MHNFLGTILVQKGIITQEQLEDALKNQSEMKGKKGLIGKTLVRLGYCTEDDIARVIAERSGIPYISLETYQIDPAAVTVLSIDNINRYKALPVSFADDKLVVAMNHPNDIMSIDDLRMLTGYDIKPVMTSDTELEATIEKYSRESLDVEQEDDDVDAYNDLANESVDDADRPAIQLANMILSQALSARASDIHIEPYEKNSRVRFRIDGVLHDIMQVPRKMHATLTSRIKVMANMDIADRRVPQDGRISLKIEGRSVDLRVATLPTAYGERLTLRLLERSGTMITLEQLGIRESVLEKYLATVKYPYGLILVTGPTGSGKTTSLYASLATIDTTAKNVITVEDPVEYRIEGVSQIPINTKVGLTFETGLRSILRNDPDIIMVGEIRDKQTARIATESALTGHLVLSTLHTNDAPGAISRLIEMGIEPFLIVSSLTCVLAQRLARVLCSHCKESYKLSRKELMNIEDFPLSEQEEEISLYRPRGCIRCSNTGYRGRVGIFEVLFATEKIQQLTLEKRSTREIREVALSEGMTSLRRDGLQKVKQGITSLEEVMRVVI
jgi:type IV pilus assembly protein PilB|nr:ATPase, T2SS/T4P/T4SS family [Desulfofarcimen acetoxidans]